jgi:hypothetical protein
MPGFRRLVVAGLFTVLCTAPVAHAQQAKLFQDSWFWGLHGGATLFGTQTVSGRSAGTLGAEWMITRSKGGLYVSYDQASFNSMSAIVDPAASNGVRPVSIHDMRTGSIAGVAFPAQFGAFRPYAGVGFAISVIGNATPEADIATTPGTTPAPVSSSVLQNTEDARSRSTVFLMGGGQWQHQRVALFGQVTVIPGSNGFLIDTPITQLSAGLRYNFGSSIDR